MPAIIVLTKPEPPNTARVWIVRSPQSNVYYCSDSPSFGGASPGEFMSETMSKLNGYKPNGGTTCEGDKH